MTYKAPQRRTIDARWSHDQMYPTFALAGTERAAERELTRLFPTQPYGTHGSVCAMLLRTALEGHHGALQRPSIYRDGIIRQTLQQWTGPLVGSVLVYSRNNPATKAREPKPLNEQRQAFRRNLFAAYPLAVQSLTNGAQQAQPPSFEQQGYAGIEPPPIPQSFAQGINEAINAAAPPEPEPEPEPATRAGSITIGSSDPLRAHHEWSVGVRRVMADHDHSWSMRPTIDGIALIAAGCPVSAVRDACLMDYPNDLRSKCGVDAPFDFAGFGTMDYLTKAASARVDDRGKARPVCIALVGPAGTGKTTAVSVLASALNVARYDVSMSGGTPMSAFYGIDRLNAELTLSDFERWAVNGGIHLFDEMDCSDPNLLKIVNKALANRDYTNPLSGRRIELSPDAVAIAGMNTLGVGIQAEYSASEQLDFSTIDRFRAGRVRWDIDESLESRIVDAQIASIRQ